MNAYWLIFSIPRHNRTKTQAETTGNVFGQCSCSICAGGVCQSKYGSAWQLMASHWSTGCFHVCCYLFLEPWGMSVLASMVQTAENSLLHLQSLRVDPHLPCPHRRTGLGRRCTLGAASVHTGWKFWQVWDTGSWGQTSKHAFLFHSEIA